MCPSRKKPYVNRAHAAADARAINRKSAGRMGRAVVFVCRRCGAYHVGHERDHLERREGRG